MSEYHIIKKESLDALGFELIEMVGDKELSRHHVPIGLATVLSKLVEWETAPLLATIQAQQANLQAAADLLEAERAKSERYKAVISHAKSLLGKNTVFKPFTFEAFLNLKSALEESEASDGTQS